MSTVSNNRQLWFGRNAIRLVDLKLARRAQCYASVVPGGIQSLPVESGSSNRIVRARAIKDPGFLSVHAANRTPRRATPRGNYRASLGTNSGTWLGLCAVMTNMVAAFFPGQTGCSKIKRQCRADSTCLPVVADTANVRRSTLERRYSAGC
jgi:hypothetical protein